MIKDYSYQNHKGKSFKNQDLTGKNFSHSNIQGADFTNAILKNTNFSYVSSGLGKQWLFLCLLISCCLQILAVTLAALSGYLILFSLKVHSAQIFNLISFWLVLLSLVLTLIISTRQGFLAGLGMGIIFLTPALVIGLVLEKYLAAITMAFFIGLGADCLIVTGLIIVALSTGIAITVLGTTLIPMVESLVLMLAASFYILYVIKAGPKNTIAILITSTIVTVVGNYISKCAFTKAEKIEWIRDICIRLGVQGGTNFRGADLTNANFSYAILKNTNFRKANLTQTCWFKVKKLDLADVDESYLKHTELQQLMITKEGKDKNFDHFNLQGVNLQEANLSGASFIGTDLSKANLQNANLSRAKLVQTQLNRTDLTGATLTGAIIEDWGITSHTKLHGIRCEYIFMRLPTEEDPNPHRKPDNWNETFTDGDFADFIKPIVDTLDLYHNQGVDPRAIAISFKQLAENHPEAELEIVAMEKRGRDKFLLRAKTAETADKSELSAKYFATYNQMKGLPEREIKLLLAEKENQIRRLENMVMTALERPSFYSNVEQVGFMTNNPSGISQNMSGGTMHGGMQAAQGNQNQQSMESHVIASDEKQLTKEDVVRMLAQIEQLVESTPELPQADKEKSLRYLGAAKEEAQATEPDKQFAADNLKRVAATLKTTSETVATTKTLWENVKPVLKELPGWLGVAKTFFGF